MKKTIALLLAAVLALWAAPCLGEESPTPTPLIIWHTVAPRISEPAQVDAPEITIDGVAKREYGVSFVPGAAIVIRWQAVDGVKAYHVAVADEDDREVNAFETTDTRVVILASELSPGVAYALTVTAIPVGGTLADGASKTTRFALYAEPTPEPTPTPEPKPTPEPVMQTGEISDSWEQIIAAIDDGTAQQRYAVGVTKALELSGIGTVHMQLAGFNLDERADGNGKTATTWIAVELLPEGHAMNEKGTTEGGWRTSNLRAYLKNTVYQALPGPVRQRVVSVKKRQYDYFEHADQITEDLVWIPDKAEIFGEDSLYYELFRDKDENRKKQQNGSAAWWWLRSATSTNTFYTVYYSGGTGTGSANISGGLALGFCL